MRVNRNYFTPDDVVRLKKTASLLRKDILRMIFEAKAGHPGGSLSAVEVITALYFHVLNIDRKSVV